METTITDTIVGRYWVSNDPPSADDRIHLEDAMSGPLREIDAVAKEMEDLRLRLSAYSQERQRLEDSIHKHRVILSVFRRLPEDVLGEIFIRCLPDKRIPALHISEAPLLLTRVCRRWRDIACHLPQLWAAIHLVVPQHPPNHPSVQQSGELVVMEDKPPELIGIATSRAQSLPLTLSLDGGSYGDFNYDQISGTFRWMSAQLFPRTKSLRLSGLSLPGWTYIGRLPAQHFTNLEQLNIHWIHQDEEPVEETVPPFLLAPKLSELDLRYEYGDASRLPLRWQQLTRLMLSGMDEEYIPTIAAAIGMLRNCPTLEHCGLWVRGDELTWGRWDHHPPRIEVENRKVPLPFLKSLSIYHHHRIESFTRELYIPNLESLTLTYGNDSDRRFTATDVTLPNFLEYHDYCLANITRLDMTFVGCPTGSIIHSLQRLSHLRHLVVLNSRLGDRFRQHSSHGFNDHVLSLMTPQLNGPSQDVDNQTEPDETSLQCLCPLLDRFEFRERDNYDAVRQPTLSAVASFIEAKWEASRRFPGVVSHLKHLTVPTRTLPDMRVRPALREWVEKTGLVVEIAYPYFKVERVPTQYEGLLESLDGFEDDDD